MPHPLRRVAAFAEGGQSVLPRDRWPAQPAAGSGGQGVGPGLDGMPGGVANEQVRTDPFGARAIGLHRLYVAISRYDPIGFGKWTRDSVSAATRRHLSRRSDGRLPPRSSAPTSPT